VTVAKARCYVCGKEGLSKKETGLANKLLGGKPGRVYCLGCLAEYLEVEEAFLLAKAEEFREQGCELF